MSLDNNTTYILLNAALNTWNANHPEEKLDKTNDTTLKTAGLGKTIFASFQEGKWEFINLSWFGRLLLCLRFAYGSVRLDKDSKDAFLQWRKTAASVNQVGLQPANGISGETPATSNQNNTPGPTQSEIKIQAAHGDDELNKDGLRAGQEVDDNNSSSDVEASIAGDKYIETMKKKNRTRSKKITEQVKAILENEAKERKERVANANIAQTTESAPDSNDVYHARNFGSLTAPLTVLNSLQQKLTNPDSPTSSSVQIQISAPQVYKAGSQESYSPNANSSSPSSLLDASASVNTQLSPAKEEALRRYNERIFAQAKLDGRNRSDKNDAAGNNNKTSAAPPTYAAPPKSKDTNDRN